jgi:hypothetical protein
MDINTTLHVYKANLATNAPQATIDKTNESLSVYPSKTKDTVELSDKSQAFNKSAKQIMSHYNIREASPREMASLSAELHSSGILSFDSHALLSFQPELNAEQFNKIMGETAEPDRTRDFILDWEEKLAIQKKSGAPSEFIQRTEQILSTLNHLQSL